jgi:site-specific DNA-methyltransferase (adenine-specific)
LDIALYNEDFFDGVGRIADASVDLIIADPPYGLGKDYGNDSDHRYGEDYLAFSRRWIDAVLPKLKLSGSVYVFLTWQHAPEVFSYLKTHLLMVNEIIWDRRVPSMGGSTRKFSSVHDNIGFFAASRDYYFDLDSIRIPYDAQTKKARSRSIFVGKKWLEVGYNPKDVWSVTRLHRQDAEREDHPTQLLAIVERMLLASSPPGGLCSTRLGSGTAAERRLWTPLCGFELNSDYLAIAKGASRRRYHRSASAMRTRAHRRGIQADLMPRIQGTFGKLRQSRRKAPIPYVTAGIRIRRQRCP